MSPSICFEPNLRFCLFIFQFAFVFFLSLDAFAPKTNILNDCQLKCVIYLKINVWIRGWYSTNSPLYYRSCKGAIFFYVFFYSQIIQFNSGSFAPCFVLNTFRIYILCCVHWFESNSTLIANLYFGFSYMFKPLKLENLLSHLSAKPRNSN